MSLSNPSNPLKASGSSIVSPVTTLPVKAPLGVIVWWSGTVDNIPTGWHLCDGEAGTIDLRDKFVLAAGDAHTVGETGGSEEVTLTAMQMPSHTHGVNINMGVGSSPSFATSMPESTRRYVAYVNGLTTLEKTNTASIGVGEPHPNMPPYYTLCAIQKIAPDETDAADISFDNTMQANADGSYGVTTPVRSITQAEYDALTDKSGFYIITDAEGTTPDPNGVAIMLSQTLPDGGTVTGGGIASKGMTVTVNAEPADGHIFNGWEENGEVVTNNASYSFLVENNRSLMADFAEGPHFIAGVDWFETSLPTAAAWSGITYGDGKFVAVSGSNSSKAIYSTDGINWTETSMPNSRNWYGVCYADGKFVSIAKNTNVVAYSIDGIDWTEVTLPANHSNWSNVVYGDDKFLAIRYNAANVAYSFDGSIWYESNISISSTWAWLAYGNGKFVTHAGSVSKIAYSTDGLDWTMIASPNIGTVKTVAYGDGVFVIPGTGSNKAIYSTDGITWAETTMPVVDNWLSMTYGDNKFVAVSNSASRAAYSADGIHWTESNLPFSGGWNLVAYGDGTFVALSENKNIAAYSKTT